MVITLDSQFSGPRFKYHSGHYPDLFLCSPKLKSSATLVNSQLVGLRPVGILNNVLFILNYTHFMSIQAYVTVVQLLFVNSSLLLMLCFCCSKRTSGC